MADDIALRTRSHTPKPRHKPKGEHKCICGWGDECKKWRKALVANNDRRGGFIKLTFSDRSTKSKKWKAVVIKNLFYDISTRGELPMGDPVYVAKHHFSEKQLEYLYGGETRPHPSTPVSRHQAVELNHAFDSEDYIKESEKEPALFFLSPNVPAKLLRKEMEAVEKGDRLERAGMREIMQEEREERRLQLEEQQERDNFDNMSFEEWKATDRDHTETLQALRHENQEKDMEVEDLKQKLANYQKQVANLRLTNRRRQNSSPAAAVTPSPTGGTGGETMFSAAEVNRMIDELLAGEGGLSRLSLTNEAWHEAHPTAASTLFGFRSYKEMVLYIQAFFPDIDTSQVGQRKMVDGKLTVEPAHLTKFEQLVATKLFMHSMPVKKRVALVFNVKREATMGSYIDNASPRWGKAGEQISNLIITEEYLNAERPEESPMRISSFCHICMHGDTQ